MFYDRLKEACTRENTSVTAVLKSLGLGTANGTYWKKGSVPSSDVVIQLAELLKVTTDYLLTGKEKNPAADISTDEQELLTYYKDLDDISKASILGKAEGLAEAAARAKKVTKIVTPEPSAEEPDEDDDEPDLIEIDLYDLPASAGVGSVFSSDGKEVVSVPFSPAADSADFAVRVSGDSMEPRFYDGDIVYVKSTDEVEKNDVGIFVLNGETYIKKYGDDRLISVNGDYDDILVHDYDSFYCVGRVLGKQQI